MGKNRDSVQFSEHMLADASTKRDTDDGRTNGGLSDINYIHPPASPIRRG